MPSWTCWREASRKDKEWMLQPACPYPDSEPASREKVRLGKEKEARRVSQCVAMLLASFAKGSLLLVNASRSTQTQKPGLRFSKHNFCAQAKNCKAWKEVLVATREEAGKNRMVIPVLLSEDRESTPRLRGVLFSKAHFLLQLFAFEEKITQLFSFKS